MAYSGVALPKWKSYTMGSIEPPPLILRDPPKSIHTRKKERVDMSNVNYMIRNDDTRINEGVAYLQRGINPHTDVMYNNAGGGGGGRTTTMANVQASNPYKVMKDGAFRPPLFTQEDILPLSRQRRPETMAITNPGLRNGYNVHNLVSVIDRGEIHTSIDKEKINYVSVRPTASFKMQLPTEVFPLSAIHENITHIEANAGYRGQNFDNRIHGNNPLAANKNPLLNTRTTNISLMGGDVNRDENIDINNYIKDNVLLKNISPNFSILIYNPSNQNYSEVFSSTRERLNLAVQSSLGRPLSLQRDDGTFIKIKDYVVKTVTAPVGGDNLIIQLNNSPDIELERNTPLYAVGSNISGNKKIEHSYVDPVMNERINTSATSSISMRYGRNESVHDKERNIQLRGMGSVGSFTENFSAPMVQRHSIPTLKTKQIAAQDLANRYAKF